MAVSGRSLLSVRWLLASISNMSTGLLIAITAIVATIIWTLIARRPGHPAGRDAIVRCSQGHLYTTIWIPGASFKSIRLGTARCQWCPVGRHWTSVTLVRESELTDDEIQSAHEHHDIRIP
jgi:hypothetical protein